MIKHSKESAQRAESTIWGQREVPFPVFEELPVLFRRTVGFEAYAASLAVLRRQHPGAPPTRVCNDAAGYWAKSACPGFGRVQFEELEGCTTRKQVEGVRSTGP